MNTGEYITVRDLLKEGKHGLKDGKFEELSEDDLNDLVEFVMSL